ncbi:hypothetical protein [Oceanirhabdus sp. W0125-5]|uniref:hypothetical protein n=1 Tax=Oceanirhabdus sp. W0125-5 TaxID=2999116 RepID=UPI0022F2D396|nr:hypothetical protein [Oceanirhabdus sp. W0125-5]WBW98286.1 hypothetical protein OW730_05820 [Oceanirhabdus sp. W0125-5]
MKKNEKTIKEEDINYKALYTFLIDGLKNAVLEVNSSDYSKKSLGRFKDKVERLLYNCNDLH